MKRRNKRTDENTVNNKLIDGVVDPVLSEKSVEWNFVKLLIVDGIGLSNSSPIAGKSETAAGDARVKYSDLYHLIEFKKSLKSHSSEFVKFHPKNKYLTREEREGAGRQYLDLAKDALHEESAAFHHVIYSDRSNPNVDDIDLCLENYWLYTTSGVKKERSETVKTIKNSVISDQLKKNGIVFGVAKDDFISYVKELALFRGFRIDDGGNASSVKNQPNPVLDPSSGKNVNISYLGKDENNTLLKDSATDQHNNVASFLSLPVIKRYAGDGTESSLVKIGIFTLGELIFQYQNDPPGGADGEGKDYKVKGPDNGGDQVDIESIYSSHNGAESDLTESEREYKGAQEYA